MMEGIRSWSSIHAITFEALSLYPSLLSFLLSVYLFSSFHLATGDSSQLWGSGFECGVFVGRG